MSIDLAVVAAAAWPSSMPPPRSAEYRVDSVIAACFSVGITRAERSELFDIASRCKAYLGGELSSTERRQVPPLRARVMHIARRHEVDDVIRPAVEAAVREPGLSSTDAHVVRGTQAAAALMLALHTAGLCAYADAEL